MSRPINLFFSYSHQDEKLRDELAKHLGALRRKKVIADWHDRQIGAGEDWAQAIEEKLRSADIILLLVSPDFLHSDFCAEVELKQAMARDAAGEACVIPIILRPSDWHDEPFARLQALPKNAKPITTWPDLDEALLDVVKGIRDAVQRLKQGQTVEQKSVEQNIEQHKGAERSLQEAPLVESPIVESPPLPTFQFEIMTVNDRGREIDRRSGQASYFREELVKGVFLDMVAIPGGTFWMGAAEGELEARDSEKPQHQVTIEPFSMGKFAVTQAQWVAVSKRPKVEIDLNFSPSEFKGAKHPVERVSWLEAVEFCDRLSRKTGRTYRLPSEAEWEYACRAGTKTPFHFGETITTDLVNFDGADTYASAPKGQYRKQTTEVGSFPANAFGLYDMHGNVWEWCADYWHSNYQDAPTDGSAWISEDNDTYRLLRGGSWSYYPRLCRSASRYLYDTPDYRVDYIGFRVVCSA